jgi:aspartyl-tRNA(Asn)/glutamyl-tRNA(Gln) amidotransferase subunit A
MDTQDLSIAEMGRLLRSRAVSAETLARDALTRIAARDTTLHAFVLVTADRALADARRADDELKSGRDRGPFHGIPYALKDIYDTAGIRTTCHSKLRINNVPKEDSVAAARLREAGGVLLGKLATHEFAIGGPSFDLPFPPSRNPWNVDHVTGGSSSGSATAIASRMVRMAMGSDTGGSIRGPAAWCGTVGIKPTYGRVSRRGVFPLSWTLDHIGPLSRSVEDSAITLQVLAGHDEKDPASADVPVPDYRADLEKGVAGLRIGIPRGFFATAPATTRDVVAGIDRTAAQLRAAGATVEDMQLPDYALFSAVGRVIMMAEAFAIHEADMQNRLLDYGEITAGRFILGATITAADLLHAQRARRELTDAVNGALTRYDALLTVAALNTAPRFDQPTDAMSSASPMQTIPFNVTGHPSISVPVGLASDGMPIGVQISGRAFDEAMMFRIGRAVEKLSGWESVSLPSYSA